MGLQVDIKKELANFTLDVHFEAGAETLGFLGASGCGKSYTLRCIAGVETPDEGRIVVNDRVFFDSAKGINLKPQQRKTALLFQNYQLFPNMTVEQNVAAGMDAGLERGAREEAVGKYLALFNLQGFEKRYPLHLSGGQQQRVALARMLAAQPQILMLDEPFSALDAHLKSALEQNLLDLFDVYPSTILYVSHDIDEAFRFCDRIAVVNEGKIVDMGPTSQIVDHPACRATIRLSGCKNISAARKVDDHHVEALDWGVTLHVQKGAVVPDDVRYLGVRAFYLRRIEPGRERENAYNMRVHRVSDSRFERTVMLTPPSGNEAARIQWKVDKLATPADELPEPGDVLRMHFDANKLYLVSS